MKTIRYATSVLAVLLGPLPALATTDDPGTAMARASISADGFTKDASVEKLLASTADYCAAIERAFPRNTPDDERWIDKKLAAPRVEPFVGEGLRRVENRMVARFVGDCTTFVKMAATRSKRSRALAGLSLAFQDFEVDGEKAAQANRINSTPFVFGLLPTFADALLRAAVASPD